MTIQRRGLMVAVGSLLGLLVGAADCRAGIAGAEDPKTPTHHDELKKRLDFNKRTLSGAYQSVGKRNPKWDAAAIKLLDAMAVRFTYGIESAIYQTVDIPSRKAALALAKDAIDAGCDDPLVAYCNAALSDDGSPKAQALLADFERVTDQLMERNYPPIRVSAAAQRVIKHVKGHEQEHRDEFIKYMKIAWGATLALADVTEERDIRPSAQHFDSFYEDLSESQRSQFLQLLSNHKAANPWFVALYSGKQEADEAWKARGNGWANTVNDAGWRGFFDHLTKARDLLVKAYEMHPDYPEAASEMIRVAMGAGDRLGTTPREWFDKTTKAQLDYYPAYKQYEWSIYPRWGGSYEKMFRFGLECAATERYDTYIPYSLMVAVQHIDEDSSDNFAVFKVPPIHAALQQMLTKMYENAGGKEDRNNYLGQMMGMEWRIGDYVTAAQLADKLGTSLEPWMFSVFRGWGPEAMSQIRVMNSPQAATVTGAQEKASSGDFAGALEEYRKASKALPADHPGQFFLRYRAKAMEMRCDLDAGKNVSLAPDPDFAPWAVVSGDWKLGKDGTITATSGSDGQAELVCRGDFGHEYELEARVNTVDPKGPTIPALLVEWTEYRKFSAAAVAPAISTVFLEGGTARPTKKVEFKGNDLVTVRVANGLITVLINGEESIPGGVPVRVIRPGQESFVALAITGQVPGQVAKFSDVKIRKPSARPVKP